jgi:xylulose-5-phosphate/fructose-6-phosphate phosphoketolase
MRDIAADAREALKNKLIEHQQYIRVHGEDMPEILNWQWTPAPGREVPGGREPPEEPV